MLYQRRFGQFYSKLIRHHRADDLTQIESSTAASRWPSALRL
jgi:hypothetical protein